jgi:hypothetical protein
MGEYTYILLLAIWERYLFAAVPLAKKRAIGYIAEI